jgi:hypothetical protein
MTKDALAQLRLKAERATKGEWWSDSVGNEGTYGSGDDCVEGFTSYAVYDENNQILMDTLNSSAACIQEEYDGEGHVAWDEVGQRNAEFTLNGATGANWVEAVKGTLQALHAKNYRDPVTLYFNYDDWFYASVTDYQANYPKTILARVMEIPGIQTIVPAGSVPASEILGIVKRPDVAQVLNGMPMTTRPKSRRDPEDDYIFSVLAAAAVQYKHDFIGQAGYVQFTK